MRVRGAGAEVHVVAVRDDAAVVVRVSHDRPVGQHMFMIVCVLVVVAVMVIVAMMLDVVVTAVGVVQMAMIMAMLVLVLVPVHGAVGMPMLASVLFAFDLRFAAAAAACRAHDVLLGPPQAISISFTRISSPCVTCSW
jgi:hypothetical protein